MAASLIAVIIACSEAGSKQRTSEASTASRSAGVGRRSVEARAEPIWITCDSTEMPRWERSALANVPAATRAAVSRAEARSSTSRASSKPYFCIPARSAWPGRGWVSGLAVAPGAGDISSTHFGHSVLRIRMLIGEPSVRPWRTPERNSTSSRSKRMRGPRP